MIRTNVVLDEKLVNSALKITKIKTRNALIDHALRELLRHAKQGDIIKLRDKIHWEGDDIIIVKDGKPLARLIAYSETINERHGGQLRGLITINDDFDAPLPDDILKLFYQDKK